jgi:hypothetical protein
MHAKRHIRISNFVFVIGEIADGLGSFQELFGLGHPACDQRLVTRPCS